MRTEYNSADDHQGIAWWNSQDESTRRRWLERAGSARPVDAWRAYCRYRAAKART